MSEMVGITLIMAACLILVLIGKNNNDIDE